MAGPAVACSAAGAPAVPGTAPAVTGVLAGPAEGPVSAAPECVQRSAAHGCLAHLWVVLDLGQRSWQRLCAELIACGSVCASSVHQRVRAHASNAPSATAA